MRDNSFVYIHKTDLTGSLPKLSPVVKSRGRGRFILPAVAVLLALGACAAWVALWRQPDEPVIPQSPPSSGDVAQHEISGAPAAQEHRQEYEYQHRYEYGYKSENVAVKLYPVGKLSVSQNRESYTDGEMLLEIPRLDFSGPVMDGTDPDSLNRGVGLFDYAQLPGPYNSNTSIAGHRDICGKEFYYIHTIRHGDLMYMSYKGTRYTYEHIGSFITGDSDWDPIKAREYPCITLMSCDPIGSSRNRMIVVGRLIGTEDMG